MPNYKLIYFSFKGKGEPIRLAFHIGGIPFEDFRITQDMNYEAIKQTLPFKQVPVLEIDGKSFGQSKAILRYIGKLAGLYPSDPLEALKVDCLLEHMNDILAAINPIYYEMDEAKGLELANEFMKTKFPVLYETFENQVNSGGFAVGNSLTIADLLIYGHVGGYKVQPLDGIPTDALDRFVKLQAIYENVKNHPKVIEWENMHK